MKFKVTALSTIIPEYCFIGTVEADTYDDAWMAGYGIAMERFDLYFADDLILYADAENAQPVVDQWITEAAEEFKKHTDIQISEAILYDKLSDYSDMVIERDPENDCDDGKEYFNLDRIYKYIYTILEKEIEEELTEQETSERFFTDGDTLLDMDDMRYQFEEAKKLGETEATRLAEYIDEWLTDFFSTREISKEEYTELLNEQEASERYFTDGEATLEMEGMRELFEEAKENGTTEATRLAEFITEWLENSNWREISGEEFMGINSKYDDLHTWLPEGSTEITTAYAEDNDMTFILKETYNAYHEPISTEVIGFYYGEPDNIMTSKYTGQLKAEY